MEFNITMNGVLTVIGITSVWCGVLFAAAKHGANSGQKSIENLENISEHQPPPATGL